MEKKIEQPSPPAPAALPPKPSPVRTPRLLIVFFLFAFPPIAWFFMWIDRTYHHWFVKLLYISGIISLTYIGFFYITVGLQLNQLYDALGQPTSLSEESTIISLLSGAALAIFQIIFASFLSLYLKKHKSLNKGLLFITIILLVISLAISLAPVLLTIASIYTFTASL